MPIDASIPLQVQQPKIVSPLDIANARAAMYRNELAKLDLQNAERATSARNAMAGGFQQGGDPQAAYRNAMAIDPETATTLQRNITLNQEAQYRAQTARREMIMGAFAPVLQQTLADYEDEIGKGVPIEKAEQNAQKRYSDQVDQIEKGGSLPPELVQWARQRKFNPLVFRYALSQYLPDAQGAPKTRKRVEGEKEIQEQYDPITKRWSEIGRGPRFAKQVDATGAAGDASGGLPKGVKEYILPNTNKHYGSGNGMAYEMVDGKWKRIPNDQLPQKLVKVGSVAAGQGAREAVFTQRKVGAAEQASADLSNIVLLPITTDRGAYQFGSVSAPSFLDATKVVMGNKMTPESGQIYNRMSAGLQRSLATVEAQGLMPSGSLTHQMDSVLWKPGDTVQSKLHALAQIRQIIDAQMKVELHNPRVSDDEKELIKEIINDVHQAVPFTHKDLIDLGERQKKNPNATLRDIVGKKVNKKDEGGKKDFSHLWGGEKKSTSAGASAGAKLTDQGEDKDEDSDKDEE